MMKRIIAKAVEVKYGEGEYSLLHRNCEHFAYLIAVGIEHSEQPFCSTEHVKLSESVDKANWKIGQSNNWRAENVEHQAQIAVPVKKSWL